MFCNLAGHGISLAIDYPQSGNRVSWISLQMIATINVSGPYRFSGLLTAHDDRDSLGSCTGFHRNS